METYLLILVVASLLNLIGYVWLVVVGFKRSILWGILIFLLSPFSAIIFAITNWFEAKYSFLLYMLSALGIVASLYLFFDAIGLERIEKISMAIESGQINENEAFLYLDPNTLLPGEEDEGEETEVGIDLDGDGIIDTPQAVITGDTNSTVDDTKRLTDPKVQADSTEIAKIVEPDAGEELEVIIDEKKEALDYPTPGTITVDPLVTPKKKPQSGSVRVKLSKINNYKGRYFIVTTKKGNQHRGILVKVTKSRIILERKIYGGIFTYKVSKKSIKRLDMFKKEYVDELS